MLSYKNNHMLLQAQNARFKPHPILQILLFVLVYTVCNSVSMGILIVPVMFGIFADPSVLASMASGDVETATAAAMAAAQKPWIVLLTLFVTGITTLLCILYCCKIEKRSIGSMGFCKAGWLLRYLKGFAIGTVMLLACALILWLVGGLDFSFNENIPVLYLLVFFVGFVIQGMSEEVLVRGYFMVSLGNRCHMALAVGISSVAFAAMHLANPGISLLAMVNLTLFGVFMGVYILRTDDLWGACAIHSAWNFAQGNLVGVPVSGMSQLPTVAVMRPQGESALFHGGSFGLEGGLVVTFVLLAVIALTIFLPQKARKAETV